MKSMVTAIGVLVIFHLLAVLGFVGWLVTSDRLTMQRLEQVVELFKPTVAEERAAIEEAARAEEEAAEVKRAAQRLAVIDAGPRTLADDLASERLANALGEQQVSRMQTESTQLMTRMTQMRAQVAEDLAKVEAAREAFEQRIADEKARVEDADFQQAKAMLEQLDAAQVRGIFDQLIQQGDMDQAVTYLAEMQMRQSAAVLAEYQDGADIETAARLVEALRLRRMQPMQDELANANGEDAR